MGFWEHDATFAGYTKTDYEPGQAIDNPASNAYALRVDYEDDRTAVQLLTELLQDPAIDRLEALVIGAWAGELYDHSSQDIVEALVAAAARLPSLKALFVGDIISEENEVSWIIQSDVSPLWEAFPQLEVLQIRGGGQLSLGTIVHDSLRVLILEAGGLPREVLEQVAAAKLPALEHLELYLGTSEYGGDATREDVERLLAATEGFPRLTYLGLRDSEIADQVAAAVATAPVLQRLQVLDLSLGTLGDEGAQALLQCPALGGLQKLDLHYHYISDGLLARFEELPITVDISDQQEEEEYGRYVSVAE